ncbi:DUF4280 domain-containing protein [Flavobacterium piscisymbiosum]|uniref:DUF4280 domain-containing protein n=1 Tax=Flavobacterium piscisymbiosum TaxID=2893753 RepID=A0ABS8MF57_9FLAO|nr:DUF4280 domain-containing protein [Flavobacterium sp. F-30]MCC9064131.1 DUF4280 domain-containing protein [Flavobacterium sp. F-30]
MSLKTITDSTLICDKGSKTVLLQVTSQKYSKIKGKLIATEKDKEFLDNILPFGRCGLLRNSCKYKPTLWQKTLKSKINNYAKLSKDSFILCDVGGRIEFKDVAENNFSHSESSKVAITAFVKEKSQENEIEKNNMLMILLISLALLFLFGAIFYKLSSTNQI